MPVNHYESSNESVKEEDFAEDVSKINAVQSMRLMKMAKTERQTRHQRWR